MLALLKRDIRLALKSGGSAITVLLFYLAIVVVVPFAVGANPTLLSTIGPAMLWIGALLAGLLGLDRLFQSDFEDGSLDLMLMSTAPMPIIVFTKCLAHWLVTGLPVVLISPIFSLLLSLDGVAIQATILTLLCGTPAISFIGAVGAAITVSLPRGGLLLSILILPLCIPVIIFGVGAVRGAVLDPDPFMVPFLLMCAITLFFSVLGPVAAAFALKNGHD